MPHLIIEYSANLDDALDMRVLANAVHDATLTTGVFPLAGTRTRLVRRDAVVVADKHPDNSFIHLQMRIGVGRTPEVRAGVAETVFERLKAVAAPAFAARPLALSMEIVEMNPAGALKHNNTADRIAARGGKG